MPRRGNAIGQGRAHHLKHNSDSGGVHMRCEDRFFFFFFFCDAGCQAKTVSHLGLSLKFKGDKEPLQRAVVKRSLTKVIDLWKMATGEYGLGCSLLWQDFFFFSEFPPYLVRSCKNEREVPKRHIAGKSIHVTFNPLHLESSSKAAWGLSEAP